MNWLDILLIIVILILTFIALGIQFIAIKDEEYGAVGEIFVTWLTIVGLLVGIAWFRFDKKSGVTIGTITSVDKNFFGTTALYIKTTETTEEKYCIEFNGDLENKAKELIGEKVKISYGTRIGLYSIGKCDDAPIESIERIDKNE